MNLFRRSALVLVLAWLFCDLAIQAPAVSSPPLRGYYMTFMRMPVMEFADWKDSFDCISDDGANTVVLWMGGGFRSKKFPITWAYNKDHKNVEADFVRELIDYAHQKKIRILLGFTPFGYDGVNQYALEHPDLKARKADGSPVEPFGIHSWGWSLCPSKAASQQFMSGYVREMLFDFYPNADGLMIESSDYNICRCPDCANSYYEREFQFVEKLSREVWQKKPEATILVYPHYFTGKKANAGTAIEAEAAKRPFDNRWQLVFTPHSAKIDSELLKNGATGIFSDQGLSLGTPDTLKAAAQFARNQALGYLPSLEPFSYMLAHEEFGASHLVGKRLSPLGFDWMSDPRRPLRELPAQVLRFAFREFSSNPDLSDEEFRRRVGTQFFGDPAAASAVDDLLFLQQCINLDRVWVTASPLVDPEWYKLKSAREQWSQERQHVYGQRLARLREISERYGNATNQTRREVNRIASFIIKRFK
jgi:hypothetical protein